MDMYIGDYGERRAYIPNPHTFADMRSVINIIHQAGGVAILAHPFSYNLSYDEVVALVRYFKALKGDAIEVYYSRYDKEKRRTLARIADENNLLYSCASDFHGGREHGKGYAACLVCQRRKLIQSMASADKRDPLVRPRIADPEKRR